MAEQLQPYKVWSCDRSVRKSLTALSLADLIEKGRQKLGLTEETWNVRVVLEDDGTEVDDEDYFSFIPPNSTLMLLSEREVWQPARSVPVPRDETDRSGDPLKQGFETTKLACDLRGDLSRIITFSNDQLQQLVDEDTAALAQYMNESDRFAKTLQEACQRQLDERTETTEIAGLLKLYHRAHETVTRSGTKRKADGATKDGS